MGGIDRVSGILKVAETYVFGILHKVKSQQSSFKENIIIGKTLINTTILVSGQDLNSMVILCMMIWFERLSAIV